VYATVGIFDEVVAHRVIGDELCAGSTCIAQQQLDALLAKNGIQASNATSTGEIATGNATDTPPSVPIGAPTPPVISGASTPTVSPTMIVNGANPAIIPVGDTYSDLGATITGPQQDLNLGITTYVNGAPMNPVQIDTTHAATDTIDYVVTDSAGLTSTSTRTVIVQAALSIAPADASSTSTATSTP